MLAMLRTVLDSDITEPDYEMDVSGGTMVHKCPPLGRTSSPEAICPPQGRTDGKGGTIG